MSVQLWRALLLIVGGVVAGVGIAGLPNRRDDPPLQVRTVETTTTTFVTTTTTTQPTTTSSTAATSTTRRRS